MEQNGFVKRGRGRPKKGEGNFSGNNIFDPNEIISLDVSEQQVNKIARGYFVGNKAIGRRKDVRQVLEERVVGRIGKQGKMLVDKLFELIEGVYMVDKLKSVQGKEEVRYYKVPPNLNAIIYALDRVLGKPKQLSVQANFSLSSLLIKSQDGDRERTKLGRGDIKEIQEESDGVYNGDVGAQSAAD